MMFRTPSLTYSSKQDILKSEACDGLLKNQLLDAVDENYLREELLNHLFSNYVKMDDPVINRNMERFNEPPDMDLSIDNYFSKQEECQETAEDTYVKITDEMMVHKLTTHIGKAGLIGSDN